LFFLLVSPRRIVLSQWGSNLSIYHGTSEAMHCSRHLVALVALMACVAFTGATPSGSGRDSVEDADSFFMDRSLAKRRASELAISDEQRGHIFEGVMRMSDAPITEEPAPDVADSLRAEVPMQDLPPGITQDIPLVQGHKFVKFDDRILIVNPSSRLVVAMIPRYRLLP
jgi:hypothetical protein